MSFVDARRLPDGHEIEADVCVVGAGAAGLALSRELAEHGLEVALLESGGEEPREEIQALYRGRLEGVEDAPLDESRLRYFGGTTNHWTAWVRPLEPIDFEARAWMPDSGWPLSREDLDPYYERAGRFLALPADGFSLERWRERSEPWRFPADRVKTGTLQVVEPDSRRLGPRFRDELARSRGVAVYLYASLLEAEPDASRQSVARLRVGTLEGRRFTARARAYVLAAGAIENARLLLLSTGGSEAGLGNTHDLVGRYYANHPVVRQLARLQPSRAELRTALYKVRDGGGAYLMLSEAVQREEQLPNCWIFVAGPRPRRQAQGRAVARIAMATDVESPPGEAAPERVPLPFALGAHLEPAPNRDSRVRLGSERDAFGQRRVVLDWRLQERDSEGVRRTAEILAREVGAAGLGRARPLVRESGLRGLDVRGSFHQMGTTRMHVDARRGVVDPSCRVHGLANLYVAGSSVFPTYGTANPTFTILALTFRLADHLREQLS